MIDLQEHQSLVNTVLGGLVEQSWIQNGALIVQVPVEANLQVLVKLRDEPQLRFDVLTYMTAVDCYPRVPRFDVVYELFSTEYKHRVRVKCQLADSNSLDELPTIDSACEAYLAANWHERECYDLMGIRFAEHPDLRRILLPEQWDGHPLRKEYPFDGKRTWNLGCNVEQGGLAAESLGL